MENESHWAIAFAVSAIMVLLLIAYKEGRRQLDTDTALFLVGLTVFCLLSAWTAIAMLLFPD